MHSTEKHQAALMKLDANSGVWQPRLRIRKYSEEAWSNTDVKTPRESGILLHALLQKLRNSEDVDNVISAAIASGQISSNESDYIKNVINAVVKHPELEVFYNSEMKSLTERDIIIPGSGMSRPDCVILDTDKATVIEYKSGAESEEHVDQVKHYINALSQMGYSHVQGKLVYLSPLKIINI
jgi:ATP-dependent exoDNAse (exonuclease V) beta subunit